MFKLTRPHNWLIFCIINPSLELRLRKYASGRLIDIGCGEKPYADMASPYVEEHIGLDHSDTIHDKSNIDIIGSAYEIPVEDNSFDTALCTDVLEHLEEPSLAIAEAYRILKPGGHGIYTVPLYWHLHEEPRDFYRYTKHGLKYLFQKSGFQILEIVPLSGFWVTFLQEFVYYLCKFRRGGPLNPLWWLIPPLITLLQIAALILNRFDGAEEFTMEYLAVVRKPPL